MSLVPRYSIFMDGIQDDQELVELACADGEWVKHEDAAALLNEIARLRDALQMIAGNTIVPEAFPDIWLSLSEAQQSHISAMLIARAALEGGIQEKEKQTT